MQIYLNGQLRPAAEAQVSVEDAGFQHGVGLFETFFCHNGKPFRLDRHLERLKKSAHELGLAPSLNTEPLYDAVEQVIGANNLKDARIRLTLTAGTLSLLRKADETAATVRQTIAVVPSPSTVFDPAYFERGVTVSVHGPMANPFDPGAGHKTVNYWARLAALRHAATLGASEAILLSVTNHLASGCVSNVFIAKDGILLTPIAHGEEVEGALTAPVLPGITREAVLEAAAVRGIPVQKQMLTIDDLLSADEVFLTNGNWKVLPVVRVEHADIGEAKPGPMTIDLRQDVLDTIARECR